MAKTKMSLQSKERSVPVLFLLNLLSWPTFQTNEMQAETQYQGDGMSHEMAALLLTLVIHHSLKNLMPLFVLLMDAKSAFDLADPGSTSLLGYQNWPDDQILGP